MTRKERYWKNPEKARAQSAAWAQQHPDHVVAYRKSYHQANRDRINQRSHAWAEANPERRREGDRAYRESHKEELAAKDRIKGQKPSVKEYKKRWHEANKDRIHAEAKKRYAAQREQRLLKQSQWRERNREQHLTNSQNRRAALRNAAGKHTVADIKALWDRQHKRCAIEDCPHSVAASGPNKYHVDHIQPLSRGGSNDPFNLQLLCKHHNLEKHATDETVWANRHGLLFVK